MIIGVNSTLGAVNLTWAPIGVDGITMFVPYAQTNEIKTLKDVYKPDALVSLNVNAVLTGDQDWVGVYPKNTANNWENVIAWNWIPHNGNFTLSEIKKNMPVGAYEARLFFHNNFEPKASYLFAVSTDTFKTIKTQYAPNETVSVMVNVPLSGDKDWVGVFPKGADNSWGHVIAWNWIANKGTFELTKDPKAMPIGKYEVRLFYNNSFKLEAKVAFNVVSDNNKYPQTIQLKNAPLSGYEISKPLQGESIVDNVLGTKITKVDKVDGYNSHYPKIQSWNKDMTLLRIGYRIYDAHTYKETDITKYSEDAGYDEVCGGGPSSHFRWSHHDANKFFTMKNSKYHAPTLVIAKITGNTVKCDEKIVFNDYEVVYMTLEEGNIDNNDQYVSMMGKKKNDNAMYIILYDIKNKIKIWDKKLDLDDQWVKVWNKTWLPDHLDWISVTPSGKRIVAMLSHNLANTKQGIYVYDMNLSNRIQLKNKNNNGTIINTKPEHGDMGYDIEGKEVLVQYMTGVGIYMFNLENPNELGIAVVKSNKLSTGHISCRNTKRPGWCYVSPYNQDSYGYIFALKLKAIKDVNSDNEKKNVQLFSRTFKNNLNYYTTFGSPSPDGTKVIFNTEDGGTFMAEVNVEN